MKKVINVIRWIGVANLGIFALVSLTSGGLLATILFVLGGLIIAPLGFISKVRSKLRLNKALSIVLAIVLLFAGFFAFPISEEPKQELDDPQIPGAILNSATATVLGDSATATPTNVVSTPTATATNKVEENTPTPKPTATAKPTITAQATAGATAKPTTTAKPTAKPTVKPTENNQEDNSKIVYTTKTGKKYHSTKSCRGLNNANTIYDSTLSEAKNKNLAPCDICYVN